jgi:hypothetical protein
MDAIHEQESGPFRSHVWALPATITWDNGIIKEGNTLAFVVSGSGLGNYNRFVSFSNMGIMSGSGWSNQLDATSPLRIDPKP